MRAQDTTCIVIREFIVEDMFNSTLFLEMSNADGFIFIWRVKIELS